MNGETPEETVELATWADLEAGAPAIAEKGRDALYRTGEGAGLLATVRGDASPRIHPINVGWRVSRDPAGIAFSTSTRRSNRFSPLFDPNGSVIPAWYGASSEEGAIFESVFHDIRPSHKHRRVSANQYADRILAEVKTVRVLRLVDLTSVGLHAIGRSRAELIDSPPRRYAATQAVAAMLRAAAPDADGFRWVSRANDATRSFVLYQDSGRSPMIGTGPSIPRPLGTGPGLDLLRRLATDARIVLVVPTL